MKNKNIVITGGLGFIGSNIANELIDNNKITIIDNLSTGKIENLNNIDHENLNLIIGDLNEVDLNEILNGVDYVFHEAAMASVPLSIEKPLEAHKNNITATVKLLIAAKNNEIKKLLFASSSAIYGNNENMPLSEDEIPKPLSPYASTKIACEMYFTSFYDSYGLKSTALRYFNVFGPKQDIDSQYAAVIPNFINALLNNEEAVIYGDGEQSRDFIYVKDVVKANIKACKSNYVGSLNLASGKALSINELYEIINSLIGTDLKPVYLDERQGDIKKSHADINKLREIDFKPDLDFEKQLLETIEWFKK